MAVASICGETLNQGERDRSMSYLHATRKQFLDTVSGLTEGQWKYKPSADRWSVEEVAEHLAVTEETVYGTIQKAIESAPQLDKKAAAKGKDELILKAVPDRSRRVQAPETVQPAGRWKTMAEAVAAFKSRRDRTIEFVQTTQADVRGHFAPHPFLGDFDCYQWTVFLAAHADRHIQQMKEVVGDAGFPKR